ncbi:hypothetical protein HDK90DRAFT_532330 [Phyllosticta capitalensis]|uniref:BTB domain-containing protein n=1 Tax=Phyllosticta capitalensis TaxID=121624 RepID=A0ABR1YX31_9PEZI
MASSPASSRDRAPQSEESVDDQPNSLKRTSSGLRAKLSLLTLGLSEKAGQISNDLLSRAASINNLRAAVSNDCLTNLDDLSDYQSYAINISIAELNKQKLMNDELATIYVGDGQEKFVVHEMLLSQNSKFFQACLKQGHATYNWKEARQHKIDLPEDHPAVFAMFVRYLYTSKCIILPNDKLLEFEDPEGKVQTQLHGDFLFLCYIFAEKILARDFQNKIMDFIIDGLSYSVRSYFPAFQTNVGLLWDNLPPNSKLRRLFLDVWSLHGCRPWLDETRDLEDGNPCNAPIEFWQELALKMWHFRDNDRNSYDSVVRLPTSIDPGQLGKRCPWIDNRRQYLEALNEPGTFPPKKLQQMIRIALTPEFKTPKQYPPYA